MQTSRNFEPLSNKRKGLGQKFLGLHSWNSTVANIVFNATKFPYKRNVVKHLVRFSMARTLLLIITKKHFSWLSPCTRDSSIAYLLVDLYNIQQLVCDDGSNDISLPCLL